MSKDFDVEDILKRFQTETDPRIKASVMSRYRRMRNKREFDGGNTGFWRRPIPLYLAAASLVVVAGLSLYAGRQMSQKDPRPPEVTEQPAQPRDIITSDDIEWSVAQSDLL